MLTKTKTKTICLQSENKNKNNLLLPKNYEQIVSKLFFSFECRVGHCKLIYPKNRACGAMFYADFYIVIYHIKFFSTASLFLSIASSPLQICSFTTPFSTRFGQMKFQIQKLACCAFRIQIIHMYTVCQRYKNLLLCSVSASLVVVQLQNWILFAPKASHYSTVVKDNVFKFLRLYSPNTNNFERFC